MEIYTGLTQRISLVLLSGIFSTSSWRGGSKRIIFQLSIRPLYILSNVVIVQLTDYQSMASVLATECQYFGKYILSLDI